MMRRMVVSATALALPKGLAGSSVRTYTDAKTIRAPYKYDQVVNAENEAYVESILRQYKADHSLVDPSWVPALEALLTNDDSVPIVPNFSRPISSDVLSEKERKDNMRLSWMVRAYEKFGHHLANLNPLDFEMPTINGLRPESLDPTAFGFTEEDLSTVFNVTFGCNYEATFVSGSTAMSLADITNQLKKMYCGTMGFEFMSSGYFDIRNWFRQEIVNTLQPLPAAEKAAILDDVVKACGFENFLQIKYATQQRFGLDGGEALVPMMNALIDEAAHLGLKTTYLGMAHRGRLNILTNVCNKALLNIFNEFEGKAAKADANRSGDVKYHLGVCKEITTRNGHKVTVDFLPNPSHLEAVNPLVLGKARAHQVYTGDADGTGTLPILIHGDAAFAGQGSCYETMGFCQLENYHVGGTIHIVTNNEIGFTTEPNQSRSSTYCSDLAHVNNAPVIHVNGDDVEAVVRAAKIAARFRQEFQRDIIIDLVCYRRNGHNEADLPNFTQPQLYDVIAKHPKLVDVYGNKLVAENLLTPEQLAGRKKDYENRLREVLDASQSSQEFIRVKPHFDLASENTAETMIREAEEVIPPALETGVEMTVLKEVGMAVTKIPQEMQKVHPIVDRSYTARRKAIEAGDGAEWCLGEILAFGTMAKDGIHIRVSGEDVERGTFTQRHAVITDMQTNLKYMPLATVSEKQAVVHICNSSLSELGVSGFEVGYNMENPKNVNMWEAQFGDFANGAQVIFDQFLGSGEEKWNSQMSTIISLPHGYSGAGPEHSSARMERFLQLSDDGDRVPRDFRTLPDGQLLEVRIKKYNWQVCYPSTPANYFHMLRRQGVRDFAKPLISLFSKARLRAPNLSSLALMAKGTSFLPVIDTASNPDQVARKVVFCTGQIESIVAEARAKSQAKNPGENNDVVLVTVEQLAPFPWEQVANVVEKYHERNPNVEFVWLQEEPKNMGAWAFVRPRMQSLLRHLNVLQPGQRLGCISRPSVASPSTGYGSVHVAEENVLIQQTLS